MNTFDELWKMIRELPDTSPLKHRLKRAVSWCERSCDAPDADAKCIFLWIAFNAAYAIDPKDAPATNERYRHERYFAKLLPLDGDRRIYWLLATDLRSQVLDLIGNRYVYRGFWDSLTYRPFDRDKWPKRKDFLWDRDFVKQHLGQGAFASKDDVKVLRILFDRLYVLRNQLMHGCATQDGTLNRSQVECGTKILESLVPVLLEIMATPPLRDWGPLPYPVRDDIRQDK